MHFKTRTKDLSVTQHLEWCNDDVESRSNFCRQNEKKNLQDSSKHESVNNIKLSLYFYIDLWIQIDAKQIF